MMNIVYLIAAIAGYFGVRLLMEAVEREAARNEETEEINNTIISHEEMFKMVGRKVHN